MLAFNQTVLAKDSTVQTSISVENVLERAGDSTPFSIALESIDAMKTNRRNNNCWFWKSKLFPSDLHNSWAIYLSCLSEAFTK